MKSVKNITQSTLMIKKSQFITTLIPCNDPSQINQLIQKYRADDATHNCVAYIVGGGSLTVVSNFSLTKSLKTLIISILLSFFIVKFVKIFVLIWANMCYNRHRR